MVDPYLDPDILDFVESVDPAVNWELLTGSPKALFVSQLRALQVTRFNVVARSNSLSHDRFVILDKTVVWHLGASVNGLGKKASMFNAVDDPAQSRAVLGDFASWWASGIPV